MGRLTLKVVPGAKKPDLIFEPNPLPGAPPLRVRLTQPPVDGRANEALTAWLSELSGMTVRIVAGAQSRTKTVEFAADEQSFVDSVRLAWEQEKGKRRK